MWKAWWNENKHMLVAWAVYMAVLFGCATAAEHGYFDSMPEVNFGTVLVAVVCLLVVYIAIGGFCLMVRDLTRLTRFLSDDDYHKKLKKTAKK